MTDKKLISTVELNNYLADLLQIEQFDDYCPNGLQVNASEEVSKIITGVTASEKLIKTAAEKGADAILVHHGYFWKGEDQRLIGMKGERIRQLYENNISLFAYHLPLDCHPTLGNNAQLAHLLDLKKVKALTMHNQQELGLVLTTKNAIRLKDFASELEAKLGRQALVIGDPEREVKSVGLCTGAAQSMFEDAVLDHQVDLYITGEASENTFHIAEELKTSFIGAGHHATERYGIKALGEYLAKELGIEQEFVDLTNPI